MIFKQIIKNLFPRMVAVRNRVINERVHRRFQDLPIKEVFTTIYHENHWGEKESRSGTGSTLQQTIEVKKIVESVVREFKCNLMLDLPCGDCNWAKDLNLGNCQYLGADIVDELIAVNKSKYENNRRSFAVIDITATSIPKVDLIFCRDCLVHLSFAAINRALENIKRSGSTWLLTTTFPTGNNRDVITGNWRPLNLQQPPFSFPEPVKLYNERCTEGGNRYNDKSLGLWKISELQS